MNSLITNLKTTINNEGKLYKIIKETYPKTFITGMGSPGKGEDYTVVKERGAVTIQSEEANTVDKESSGLPIIFILPVSGLVMYARYKNV